MMRPPLSSTFPRQAFFLNSRIRANIKLNHSLRSRERVPAYLFTAYVCHRHATSSRLPQPRFKPTTADLPDEEDPKSSLVAGARGRSITPYFWACCIFGFSLALYLSTVYVSHVRAVKATARLDLPQDADVSNRWRDASRNFDEEVDLSEKWLLLRAKRRRLVNEAFGNVLEVSVGTGRNMELYDLRPYDPEETSETGRSRERIVSSLTFNDQSDIMIMHAEKKFEEMEAGRPEDQRFGGSVRFIVGDAGIKGLINRPEGGYDTIVQTMGVCSASNAAQLLRRLGELCRQPGEASAHIRPDEDDGRGGRILLLEHGRSYVGYLNKFLDDGAKMHAAHYGCWWNKDVEQVIKDSGLVIERVRRYNFGTTWEVVLRPPPRP